MTPEIMANSFVTNFEDFFSTEGWSQFLLRLFPDPIVPDVNTELDLSSLVEAISIRMEIQLYIIIFICVILLFLLIRSMRA